MTLITALASNSINLQALELLAGSNNDLAISRIETHARLPSETSKQCYLSLCFIAIWVEQVKILSLWSSSGKMNFSWLDLVCRNASQSSSFKHSRLSVQLQVDQCIGFSFSVIEVAKQADRSELVANY